MRDAAVHVREDQHVNLPRWLSARNARILSARNMSGGTTDGSARNVNGNMVYKPFDDRPGYCEGCLAPDYPSIDGPSAKQISWNAVLTLWLCAECRYNFSNWMGTCYRDATDREHAKPSFLKRIEQQQDQDDESHIHRGLE